MKEEIKELKREIKALKQRISGLEKDLDYQVEQNSTTGKMANDIRDLQQAVADLAKQPVGLMFDYRA